MSNKFWNQSSINHKQTQNIWVNYLNKIKFTMGNTNVSNFTIINKIKIFECYPMDTI